MLVVGRAVCEAGTAGLLAGTFAILVQLMPLWRRHMFVGILSGIKGIAIVAVPLLGGNNAVPRLALVLPRQPTDRRCDAGNEHLLPHRPAQNELHCSPDVKAEIAGAGSPKQRPLPPFAHLPLPRARLGRYKIPLVQRAGHRALRPLRNPPRSIHIQSVPPWRRRNPTATNPPQPQHHLRRHLSLLHQHRKQRDAICLPTYYQVVRAYSPAKSGLLMLPIIIAGTVGSLIHGAGTSAFGYYAPFMLFASIIMPTSAGLLTTFKVDTSFVDMIVYSAFAGSGYGIGFSGPQTAVQTVLPTEDIPLGISIMLFAQSIGPAVAVAVAQVIFTNEFGENLVGVVVEEEEEGLSHESIETKGLGEIVRGVPKDLVGRVLREVDLSLKSTWCLVVGLACATVVGSSGIEWRSVKQKRS